MATCRDDNDKKTRRRRRNRNSIYTAPGDETWASCCPNPPCPPTHYPRGKAREQGHRHRRRLLSLDNELEPQEVLQSTQIGLSKAAMKPEMYVGEIYDAGTHDYESGIVLRMGDVSTRTILARSCLYSAIRVSGIVLKLQLRSAWNSSH